MANENAGLPDVQQEELPKIPTKSLPQMLKEVEDNIKAAVEAAGRSEEAAKSARQALAAATKASAKEAAEAAAKASLDIAKKAREAVVRRQNSISSGEGLLVTVDYSGAR